MSQKNLTIAQVSSGGLITNYYCSSRCRHCLYSCSPTRRKEYIAPERAFKLMQRILLMGCYSIHIGGGEPFLDFEGLKQVVEMARESGMEIEYIETNSSWFTNDEAAKAKLKTLLGLGVSQLLVSISPFHNEYTPFNKVKGVLDACEAVGMSIFPWVSGFLPDLQAFSSDKTHGFEEYENKFGNDYLKEIPSRYWIHLGGRALSTFSSVFESLPLESILDEAGPCTELEDVTHFHMDLYGNYIPALCSGLSIYYKDLGAPLKEEKYPVMTMLYREGPAAFLRHAEETFGFQPRESYLSKCHLCYHIRSFLVTEKKVYGNELCPAEFYSGQ